MTPELLGMAAAVMAGSTVQATLGFGSALVATLVGAWILPIERVMPLVVPLSAVQTLVVVARTPGSVDLRLLGGRILPAMGLGMIVAWLGPGIAAPGTRPVLGALVIALGALELARRGPAPPLPRPVAAAALVAAGVIQGLMGTGGPLVVWAIGREMRAGGLDPTTFRSTLNAVWLVVNGALVAALAATGRVTLATLADTALLVPFALAGSALGMALHPRVDEARFRRVLWAVLTACGVPLLL